MHAISHSSSDSPILTRPFVADFIAFALVVAGLMAFALVLPGR